MGFIEDAILNGEIAKARSKNLLAAERYGQAAVMLLDHDPQAAADLFAKAGAIAALVAQTDKPRSQE